MKITETRKEIINLISDYMDKTKSQFALVTHEKYDGEIQQLEMELDNYTDWFIKECKVIGHYDITAVLKYIENQIYLRDKYYQENCGKPKEHIEYIEQKFTINKKYIRFYDGYFPNKSLELYTDEEDKQLLDLLLKIK